LQSYTFFVYLRTYIVSTTIRQKAQSVAPIIRGLLAERGWTRATLAAAAGLKEQHLANTVTGTRSSRRARAAIEQALGCAIWPDETPAETVLTPPTAKSIKQK
jgi:lambda repressor-like predicted transcriptional regulator